jgi:hypothetical protein
MTNSKATQKIIIVMLGTQDDVSRSVVLGVVVAV